jgi:hypothetical protein
MRYAVEWEYAICLFSDVCNLGLVVFEPWIRRMNVESIITLPEAIPVTGSVTVFEWVNGETRPSATLRTASLIPPNTSTGFSAYLCESERSMVCDWTIWLGCT